MSPTLGELAVRFGCELRGDPAAIVSGIGNLTAAQNDQLSFFVNPKLRAQLRQTRAGAVVLAAAMLDDCPVAALVSAHPHATFARIAVLLHPENPLVPGVHASAVIGSDVHIDPSAEIGPLVAVGSGSRIGARVLVGPGCVLADRVHLGDDVRLIARVTLGSGVRVGSRTVVHPGAVIGADGFGLAPDQGGRWVKVPQIGTVLIGEDVEIGANTTIDRGAIEDTVIGEGVKLDNQIQIGHNSRVGAHTAIAGCVAIAGSATIGQRCQLAGHVGIAGHITICDDVAILAKSMVAADIREPGVYANGLTIEKAPVWRRIAARIKGLDELAKRVAALERTTGQRPNRQDRNNS